MVYAAGTVETTVMEPLMDGSYRERHITKQSYRCECGLVWAIKWHAETCANRQHAAVWSQRYVTGPITNGKPAAERFYERRAVRREAGATGR